MLAAIDDAADADEIAGFESRDMSADSGHAPDDFMAGDARKLRAGPFGTHLMQVGVADTAVGNVDLYVVRTRRTAGDLQWFEGLVARMCAISGYKHGNVPFWFNRHHKTQQTEAVPGWPQRDTKAVFGPHATFHYFRVMRYD